MREKNDVLADVLAYLAQASQLCEVLDALMENAREVRLRRGTLQAAAVVALLAQVRLSLASAEEVAQEG